MTSDVQTVVQEVCSDVETKCLEMSNLTRKLSFKFLLSPFQLIS